MSTKPLRFHTESSGRPVAWMNFGLDPAGDRSSLETQLAARTRRGFAALAIGP